MFLVTLECTSEFLLNFSVREGGVRRCKDLKTSTASLRYNWSLTLNHLSSFRAGETWSYFRKPTVIRATKFWTSCRSFQKDSLSSPERVENSAKTESQNAFAFTQHRIEILWKRHPNRRDSKTIPKLCEMKTKSLAVSGMWTQNLVLFRPALMTSLPNLKTVTVIAFRVIFVALFEKFEVSVNSC